eukprot:COSAG01_NODE_82_length_27810_cov_36.968352_14_plen_690_part_00
MAGRGADYATLHQVDASVEVDEDGGGSSGLCVGQAEAASLAAVGASSSRPEDLAAAVVEKSTTPPRLYSRLMRATRLWARVCGATPAKPYMYRHGLVAIQSLPSPRPLQWLARLSVGIMFAYSVAKLAHVSVWDNPYKQHAHGAAMPALRFDFAFESGVNALQPSYTSSTIDSLLPMQDNSQYARAERMSDGKSLGFPPGQIVFQPEQIVGLQFPASGLRPGTRVLSAALSMEMIGETELFPAHISSESAPLSMQVQVELSSESLPLKLRHGAFDLAAAASFDLSSRGLSGQNVTWVLPPQTKHTCVVSPDLRRLLSRLRRVDGWNEISTLTFVLTPMSEHSGTRSFQVRDHRTDSMAEFSRVLVDAVLYCILGPLLLTHLQSRPLFTQLLGPDALELMEPAPHQHVDEHGQVKPWGWRRRLLVAIVCLVAVVSSFERALHWGRESWCEARERQAFAAAMDGLLFFCASWVGLLLILWVAAFALTCAYCTAAIRHAASKLADDERLDMKLDAYHRHAMDTIFIVDKVSNDLNNDFQVVQLLGLGVFVYDLYGQLISILLGQLDGGMIDAMELAIDLMAVAALLLPAAQVTQATEQVAEEFSNFLEKSFCSRKRLAMEVQHDEIVSASEATRRHRAEGFAGEVANLLLHANNKKMGYRLFETILVSYGSLKTMATFGLTLCVAVAKARGV